ncbi:MAG TPA: 50S ribosomal protein L25 [Planctomycetes bacterium]|nr:50S ribosomal protein L25 [Planctomycetota bacterium]
MATAAEQKVGGLRVSELAAGARTARGSRACKHLRSGDMIPANVYGHKEPNEQISIRREDFMRWFRSGQRIAHLMVGDRRVTGLVKEVQWDALGDTVIHADFTRISLSERIHMRIPVVTIGIPKGLAGGTFDHIMKEIDVEGPAGEIPEKIEIHVGEMVIGDMVRVKDIPTLPASCKALNVKPDAVVVAVHAQKIVAAAEPAVEETAEPEVVGKAKEGEGEDAGEEKGEKPEKGDKPEKKEKAEKGDKGDKKK